MDEKQITALIKQARQAAQNSYSPYSRFRVGAALLTEKGNLYTGTNIENRSYGATICAERSAFAAAVSQGERKFRAICIVGLDYQDFLPPCCICRQFMSEFGRDLTVIMVNQQLEYQLVKMEQLLPYDSLDHLKEKFNPPSAI